MVEFLNETFAGAALTDPTKWIGLGAPTAGVGPAYLTASTGSTTNAGAPDAAGSGALRLTNAVANSSGFTLYNTPISTAGGLSIVFDYATYGGDGADGFSFFLVDGATSPTTPGGSGAGLGYAPRSALGGAPAPGIVGGYLGIGFDEFGNFSNFNETTGVPDDGAETAQPDTVAVRGSAGNLYNILGRSAALTAGVDVPTATTRTAATRKVLINLSTEGDLDVFIDLNNDGDFADAQEAVLTGLVTDTVAKANPVPTTVKFGFAGSTGGFTNIHEIRNLTVSSLSATPDLLWRDDSSSRAKIWYLEDTNKFVDEKTLKFASTLAFNPGQEVDLDANYLKDWKAVATVDVDGNGVADIIWQEGGQKSRSAVWYLDDGAQVIGATFVKLNGVEVDTGRNWDLVGTGDFDKDGSVDLCWRNVGGDETAFWYLEGGTTNIKTNGAVYANYADGSRVRTGESARWELSSIGDYDGDGDADLFYRDKFDGRTAAWILDGSTFVKSQFLPNVSTSLNEVASGDFNGDGKSDIVFRNSTSPTTLWTITSTGTGATTVLTATPSDLPTAGTAWELGGAGDFNGDGTDDLVFNSSPSGDGSVALWFLENGALKSPNGTAYIESSPGVKKTAPLSQFIAGVNEFGNPVA
jgi:hypothetical protein